MPFETLWCTRTFAGRARQVLGALAGDGGGAAAFVLGVRHNGAESGVTLVDCAVAHSAADAGAALPSGVEVVGGLIAAGAAAAAAAAAAAGTSEGLVVTVDPADANAGPVAVQSGVAGPRIVQTPRTSREFLDRDCYLLACRIDMPVGRRADGSWAALLHPAMTAGDKASTDSSAAGRGAIFRLQDGRFVVPGAGGAADDRELVHGLGTFGQMLTAPVQFSVATGGDGGGGKKGGKKGGGRKKGSSSASSTTRKLSVESHAAARSGEGDDDSCGGGGGGDGDGGVGCDVYPVQALLPAAVPAAAAGYVVAGDNVRMDVVETFRQQVDVALYVHKSRSLGEAQAALEAAAQRAVRDVVARKATAVAYYRAPSGTGAANIGAPGFLVRHLHAAPVAGDMPESERAALHRRFALPMDRPLFRAIGAVVLPPFQLQYAPAATEEETPAGGADEAGTDPVVAKHLACPRPRSVHVGITDTGLPASESTRCALVRGAYEYYHYLQEGFPDKGWGCAYRSLQTIFSWFRLNQYSAERVPTHHEIQAALIALRDKPASFLHSSQWIGSQEVGYCLEHFLKVESRYLVLGSGAEVPLKARELQEHFETEGTPVMCGGGALAYTILGVDYDSQSGDARFLVLDPHYVGPDDLAAIQTRAVAMEGYRAKPCSWRGAEAFNPKSGYNLCLPQRPRVI